MTNANYHHQEPSVRSFLHGVEELLDSHPDHSWVRLCPVHGVGFTWRLQNAVLLEIK